MRKTAVDDARNLTSRVFVFGAMKNGIEIEVSLYLSLSMLYECTACRALTQCWSPPSASIRSKLIHYQREVIRNHLSR